MVFLKVNTMIQNKIYYHLTTKLTTRKISTLITQIPVSRQNSVTRVDQSQAAMTCVKFSLGIDALIQK